jgi:uncharacterized protein YjbI with pentapeptide repeats/uncharacterized RDD family membrane protein YckC
MKQGSHLPNRFFLVQLNRLPLVTRRCAACLLEISLVAASALIPYGIGLYAKNHATTAPVPLNPLIITTEKAIAKALARPWRQQNIPQVPPLTNLFWCGALLAPLVVLSWQLYLLGKTGQTFPKHLFGVVIVRKSGAPPGLIKVFIREILGFTFLPLEAAYLIWRLTGAFPDLGILLGLSGLTVLGENSTLFFNPDRRAIHDRLAGTFVLNANQYGLPYIERSQKVQHLRQEKPFKVEVSAANPSVSNKPKLYQRVTTIVFNSPFRWQEWRLWDWIRQHPGMTLLIASGIGTVLVLGTVVGIQVYIQNQVSRRMSSEQNNQLFLTLVKQLTTTNVNATAERRAAIVALSTLKDPRSLEFLADLLSQEKTEELIDTIQQSLVSNGSKALPGLQKLNQSLLNDLKARNQNNQEEQRLIAMRLRATQSAIAKILTLYNPQVHNSNLSGIDLSSSTTGLAPFHLVLDKTDLSGINFKGAIMTNASLRSSKFYNFGQDKRFGTFDDAIADLSGADLKEADLTGADLTHVSMNRTNLIRAIIDGSNLSYTQLTAANLSNSQLIGANLYQTVLEDANLSAANLANANLMQANLQNANLSSAKLVGIKLTNAQLQNANLQNTDLSSSDLRGANIAGANFQGAIFAPSEFFNPDNSTQNPSTVDSAAYLQGVDFSQARNLDSQQITTICSQGAVHPDCNR